MKKIIRFLAIPSIITGMVLTSCVSGSKFKASQANVDKLQKDSTATHQQLDERNAQVNALRGDKESLLNEKTSLQNENTTVTNDLYTLAKESNLTIADQAKRLKNFQTLIQTQKNVMSKLKNSIADALMNYKTDELTVSIKDGNVYVSMEEKLLFKSGSDVVDSKGKEALKSLAKVINSAKDISVMIEGHTDNIPIKTNQYADNWDLSTARANSIVRILTIDYKFDAERITASGRGIFHPIKTNKTAEGRAGNRRTEVILSPDLKELYTLLDQ
jgi:chemotaxis protein MotB